MALSRGFIHAGAKNLIVSLWPTVDVGTKLLMLEFYDRLTTGTAPAEALRAAKLELIKNGGLTARPLFWGPFVHIGK